MTIDKKVKKAEKLDYEDIIVEYLRENPTGSTISDVVQGVKASRVTISKYISVLEAKEKIYGRKIGAYNLYYASAPSYVPKRIIVLYYLGMLEYLNKGKIPDKENFFIEMGREISKNFNVLFSSNLKVPKNTSNYNKFFKYLGRLYPSIDILQYRGIKISTDVNEEGNKALFNFTDVKLLEESENSIWHFFVTAGVLEKQLTRLLNRKVRTKVEQFDRSKKTITISIEILKN